MEKYDEDYGYTNEEIAWLNNLSTAEILEILQDEAAKRPKGDNFTLPELLDGTWEYFDSDDARQASKEFKIRVCQRYIQTVYFLPNRKRAGCYIYIRR